MNPFRMFLLFVDSIIKKILWLTAKPTEYTITSNTVNLSTYETWLDFAASNNIVDNTFNGNNSGYGIIFNGTNE